MYQHRSKERIMSSLLAIDYTHALSDEDKAVLAAQDLLIQRRVGPGRVVDTSGSFEEFSARMAARRAKHRVENGQKQPPDKVTTLAPCL